MSQNPGLTSRFPETVSFHNLPPRHCRDLLLQCLEGRKLDITGLEASPTLDGKLLNLFRTLSQTPSWGNARDVQTLAKSVFSKIMKSKTPDPSRTVSEELVLDTVNSMIKERSERAAATDPNPVLFPFSSLPVQQQHAFWEPPRPQVSSTIETETATEEASEEPPSKDTDGPGKQPAKIAPIRTPAFRMQYGSNYSATRQRTRADSASSPKRGSGLQSSSAKCASKKRRSSDSATRRHGAKSCAS